MKARKRNGFRCAAAAALMAIAVWQFGCASVSDSEEADWPTVDIDAEAPPEAEGPPRLIRGEDGLLYAVGEFDEMPSRGEFAVGRHDGDWPLENQQPPALFFGQVVDNVSDYAVRVHPRYEFPDIDTEGLRVEFTDERGGETLGKGLGRIVDVDRSGPTNLRLTLGGDSGIQEGDMYGVIAPRKREGMGREGMQLTRQLRGICMVVETDSDESICRLWQGHPDHHRPVGVRSDQEVVFLEPTFGTSPRSATVLVATSGDAEIDDWIEQHLDNYLARFPRGQVEVEFYDESVDATDEAFHRWNRRLQREEPAVFVGTTLEDRDGERHLTLNYTGLGTAVGTGMVAAPPEGGVDMGPVDEIDPRNWRGVSSVLMGALMVYRGQNAEALMHLHQALRDRALSGKWRWHARDQYAMRWAASGRFEEALWLVHEDEAVAQNRDDDQAYYNAMGTRVRLHDYVDQPGEAYRLAERYYETRRDDEPSTGYLSALAMRAEMAVQALAFEEGEEATQKLFELCPEGCQGDLIPLLAGIYWAAMEVRPDLQDQIVDKMVAVGSGDELSSLAAARMFQGWTFMRDDDFDQALIAFLEAHRLYEADAETYGAARADFYITVTQVGRSEPQEAFERGMQALEYMMEVGDHGSMVRLYDRLSQIYVDFDTSGPPREYLGAARSVLQAGIQAQMANGDFARAAEAGFSYGHFLFRIGQVDQARGVLKQAVTRGLRVARFDTVAMCHLFLAVIARAEGDRQRFEDEMQRAELMAEYADDPHIDQFIEELRSPGEDGPADDPTQLL